RRQVIEAVVQRDEAVTSKALSEALRWAPSRWQQLLAQALAGDRRHSQLLLQLVERGQASPRLLRDPTVVARLTAVHGAAIADRLERLTAGIPAASEERQQLIAERRLAFARSTASADEGRRMFQQHCAACHQLAGQGPLIGPQLDGIGNRGADRLIEDILDPNRNVDVAFSTTTLALASGKVLSGLFRREEGSQLVFVDSLGKEFTVAKDQIDEQSKARLSLMPENLADRMQEQEFYSLLVYLLEQRAEYDGKPPGERGEEG
ncbi:MAG: c-type cytochrome, partial [Pirellulaceae bacterium]|nr:c-type cytochrome [Pirellulaceae bacterium]